METVSEMIVSRCHGWVVESIESLGAGNFCSAYLVNHPWVFRFAKHDEAAASLLREFRLLPRLANRFDLRIPSPQLLSVDRPPAFMAYPMLPGPALTQERYLRSAESERQRCAGQLASFLIRMHATDLVTARECGIPVTDYPSRYDDLLARARKHLFVKLAERECAFVEHAVEKYLETLAAAEVRPVLLHGDLGPNHVLYDERCGSISGIIDFGDMTIGDPAWDLVYIYEDYGLDFLGRLFPLYHRGDASGLLERMYRLYVLDAIEWAVSCAEEVSPRLEEAVAQVGRLEANEEEQMNDLFCACAAA